MNPKIPRPNPAVIFQTFEAVSARRNSLRLIKIMTRSNQHAAAAAERAALIDGIRQHLAANGNDCQVSSRRVSEYAHDRLIGRIRRRHAHPT